MFPIPVSRGGKGTAIALQYKCEVYCTLLTEENSLLVLLTSMFSIFCFFGCSSSGPRHLGSSEESFFDFFCSDLHSLFSGIPRFAPICSNLRWYLPFIPICFQSQPGSQKLSTNFFLLKLFGRPRGGYPDKNRGISRPKGWFPSGFRATYRTFDVEDPHATGRYPDPRVWICALFFLPEIRKIPFCRPLLLVPDCGEGQRERQKGDGKKNV